MVLAENNKKNEGQNKNELIFPDSFDLYHTFN